jgi:hypothetical protein
MRKLIVEVYPKDPMMEAPEHVETMIRDLKRIMDRIESMKLLELLKLDFERGEKTIVCEIVMHEGYTIEDLGLPEEMMTCEVLKAEGNRYTCFIRCSVRDEFLRQKMREFDLDVIWTSPIHKSHDCIVYSCIGDNENLNRFLRLMSTYGEIRNVIFEQPSFSEHDILAHLTEKQRELLITAKRHGYYEYPRRITAQQLAAKAGISKATAVEHLRKAESRLVSVLLAGY